MWLLGVISCLLSQGVVNAHHLLVSQLVPSVIILTSTQTEIYLYSHMTQNPIRITKPTAEFLTFCKYRTIPRRTP